LWSQAEPSALTEVAAARQARGFDVHDFVTANPHDHGFQFDSELLAAIITRAPGQAARYGADPLGRLDAREAVVRWHGGNTAAAPEHILMTPGTSLAYFYLFRLLAEAGEILCPSPTYPLFDDLARIAGARVRRYHLSRQVDAGGEVRWVVDPDELAFQVTPRTRAIVVVSPHNPTGTVTTVPEMRMICEIANRAGAAVILDEVFRTYLLDDAAAQTPRPADCGAGLSFTLNGISKSHYLPGWKAGWMVADGAAHARLRDLMNALEYLSDSFLPVSELIQAALPELLGDPGANEVARLAQLQRERFADKLAEAAARGWHVDRPQAGPYLCLKLPDGVPSEDAALSLLEATGSYFHPGDFYSLPGYLVGTIYNRSPWPNAQLIRVGKT
jgi:aspartate/methionine/tyrosine aminotransferase